MASNLDIADEGVAQPVRGAVAPPGRDDTGESKLAAWGSRLVTVGLMFTAFSGNWHNLGSPAPLDRPLMLIGIAMCFAGSPQARGSMVLRPIHLAMLLGTAQVLLSIYATEPFQKSSVFALVDRYGVLPFLLLVSSPVVYGAVGQRRFFARVFTVWCLYLGLLALAEGLHLDALVWPRYILDPAVGIHFDRARGPYVEAVANGMMLVMSGAMGAFTFFTDPSRRWRRVGFAATLLAGVGVLLTLTRAIWLGAALAVLLAGIFVPRLRRYVVISGVLAVVGLGAAFAALPSLAQQAGQRADDKLPLYDRLNTNAAAVRMFETHPVFGVGWQQASNRMVDYVRQAADYPVTTASVGLEVHDVFLARLAELGLIGGLLWLAILGNATALPLLRRAETTDLQAWRAALLPVVVLWGTAALFGPVPYPQPNYFLWCMGGIVLVDYLRSDDGRARPTSRSSSAMRSR